MRKLGKFLIVAALLLPIGANAQTLCADRAAVTERLSVSYGEKYAGGGLRNSDSIFEVWMSEEHGTWTILMTRADGKTCVMAAGTDWRSALPEKATDIPG